MLKKAFLSFLIILLGGLGFSGSSTYAASAIELFTPYTGVSVTPGETIEYDVDLINHTGSIQDVSFSMNGLPETWSYKLTSGSWDIQQLAVQPGEPQQFTLEVVVPLKVEKGKYEFSLVADGGGVKTTLPLTVNVTEQGTFETELAVEQPNMQGHADSNFSFTATIENRTAEKQRYALSAGGPKGWDVVFKADGKNVTSVVVEPNSSKDVDIEINPPENVKKGTYTFPVQAASGSTKAQTKLEVVITGTYEMKLTTPTGRLSTDLTAGEEKTIELIVKNTGTAPLRDIDLDASTPPDWEVTFEPANIQKIKPGQSAEVKATIKASEDAIAGDYVVKMSADGTEATADAKFRVSVETSLLWGWVGVLIIIGVLGGIYYLFRTYGRR